MHCQPTGPAVDACPNLRCLCNEQGKSTVIVHRLVDRELAFQAALQAEAGDTDNATDQTSSTSGTSDGQLQPAQELHLPQLLVTRSEKLCSKLAKEVQAGLATSSYKQPSMTTSSSKDSSHSNSVTQPAETDDAGSHLVDTAAILSAQAKTELPKKFYDLAADAYPLVLTMRDLINMLDQSMPQPFTASAIFGTSSSNKANRLEQRSQADTTCRSASGSSSSSDCDSDSDSSDSEADSSCDSSDGSEFFSIEDESSGNTDSHNVVEPVRSADPSFGSNTQHLGVPNEQATEVDFALFASKRYWFRVDAALKKDLEASMVFAGVWFCCWACTSQMTCHLTQTCGNDTILAS